MATDLSRVYLWAEHTGRYPVNTGIQRVTRCAARALQECGVEVVPVRFGAGAAGLELLSPAELAHLEKWNGPETSALGTGLGPLEGRWLFIPELISSPVDPGIRMIAASARKAGMRVAVVFYDAIPYKMRGLYSREAAANHAEYMTQLADADLVFPISDTSGDDLKAFWYAAGLRNTADVRVCALPGEFLEKRRLREVAAPSAGPVRLLSVCTVEPRKNHLGLIASFREAASRTSKPLELTLVGGCSAADLKAQVEASIDSRGPGLVRWIRNADDARLSELYQQSDFTVYPSYEEGFGLPIVESLWHGRPVVCHERSAMAEVASVGGCLKTDVTSVGALADAIVQMAEDEGLRTRLAQEAVTVGLKTWQAYGEEMLGHMNRFEAVRVAGASALAAVPHPKPILSICVTTYNRARWLAHSLTRILEQTRPYEDLIEVIVCDNASTDDTGEVVKGLSRFKNLSYHRNEKNVGMLGNLGVSCNLGTGSFVWVIGDDDLLIEGSIERILSAIWRFPDTELLYLNYAYTNFDKPEELKDVDQVIRDATPISTQFRDQATPEVRTIAAKSENCFTAIYCLIFRRDHARAAYNQDVSGPAFGSLAACVPTAEYICRRLFRRPGYWIGDPCVAVNLNVSWMRLASLFILERFPELYDLMQEMGAPSGEVDRLRAAHLPNVMDWFEKMYFSAQRENIAHFSAARLVGRLRHLPAFQRQRENFLGIYGRAHAAGLAETDALSPEALAAAFEPPVRGKVECTAVGA